MAAVATPASRTLTRVLGEVSQRLSVPVNHVTITPGELPAWDACCAGMLYARIVRLDPIRTGTVCTAYRALVAVGVVRCVAVIDDSGRVPTQAEITEDGTQMLADMTEMMEALTCSEDVTALVEWVPVGAEGGCAGGEWGCHVLVPTCGPCSDNN